MPPKETLIQEINRSPDYLVEEILDFLLFIKKRRSQQETSEKLKEARPFALCAGEFTLSPNFNDPLPDEVLRDLEESGEKVDIN